jgi:hypothetical protein
MKLFRREARRLRRRFLKKIAHREFDYHGFDNWVDWEFYKCGLPLAPAFVAMFVEGPTATTTFLFVLGGALTVIWFGFVFVNLLLVYSRYGDKRYMIVTRKHLSREYRR